MCPMLTQKLYQSNKLKLSIIKADANGVKKKKHGSNTLPLLPDEKTLLVSQLVNQKKLKLGEQGSKGSQWKKFKTNPNYHSQL